MAAAALVDAGVKLGDIDNQLSIETLETLKLKGYILSNFKISEIGLAPPTELTEERLHAAESDAIFIPFSRSYPIK